MRELASVPFITFQRNRGCGLYDQMIAVCQRAGFSPRVIQEADEMQVMLGFCDHAPVGGNLVFMLSNWILNNLSKAQWKRIRHLSAITSNNSSTKRAIRSSRKKGIGRAGFNQQAVRLTTCWLNPAVLIARLVGHLFTLTQRRKPARDRAHNHTHPHHNISNTNRRRLGY